jgi:glycine reductase
MLLERLCFDIDSVRFGDRSYIDGRTLILDRNELERLMESSEFARVEVDIAAPGSSVRILNVGDVVAPTVRPDSEDTAFPGLVGKIQTVGDGRSIVLRGVVVTEVVELNVDIPTMLQLSAEAAEVTEFADMWHITVDAYPAPGVSKSDYLKALHLASKRAAKYTALLAVALEPDECESYTLERDGLEGLPRVAYLANIFCHRPFTEALVYGASMLESLPTILHPNEILDGALTNRNYDNATNADPTFVWQNHPIILELYRRHGVDLDFAGVVVSNVHHELSCKERNAVMSAAMINNNLRANAVVLTKEGGGHPQVDIGIAVDTLEGKYGIKTAIILVEMLSGINDSYGQIIFRSDHADAMVSTGCAAIATLPPSAKEIGKVWSERMGDGGVNEAGEMTVNYRTLRSGQSQLGWTRFGSLKF